MPHDPMPHIIEPLPFIIPFIVISLGVRRRGLPVTAGRIIPVANDISTTIVVIHGGTQVTNPLLLGAALPLETWPPQEPHVNEGWDNVLGLRFTFVLLVAFATRYGCPGGARHALI
jgi:hypothetical protein